jgi:hypothetical protein
LFILPVPDFIKRRKGLLKMLGAAPSQRLVRAWYKIIYSIAKFDVLIVVTLGAVFCYVAPCISVGNYLHFRGLF